MANTQQHPAAPSFTSSNPSTPPGPKPGIPLPDDMAGWLSTHESAELMGMTDRQFRHYAARHELPKRSVGVPVYYEPSVISAEVKKRKTRAQTPRQAAAKTPASAASIAVSASDDFHLKALAVLGQIVQDRGRARK